MKKIISLILSVGVVASLCGCNSGNGYLGEDYVGGDSGEYYCRIMETENGFYNNSTGFMSLSYYDKKTGKAIYLCNKPECRHDGNQFCTATKDEIGINGTYLYGDYIYFNAVDYSAAEEDGALYYRLYKTAVDATELSVVATYHQIKSGGGFVFDYDNSGRELIIHRDWAIIPFDDTDLPTLTESSSPNVMLVNVRTGECKRLPTVDYDLVKTKYGQGGFFASGDWFYYAVEPQHLINTKYLYRYNLVTGESEKIDIPKNFNDYCVYDGTIWYSTYKTLDVLPKLYKYNIESKETEDLSEEFTVGGKTNDLARFISDGNYILMRNGSDTIEFFASKDKNDYAILDMDGKKLTEFSIEKELISDDVYTMKLSGGKLYICSDYSIRSEDGEIHSFSQPEEAICCPIEDIVSGDIKWEKPYDFYSLHAEWIEEILSDMEEYEEEMENNE